MWRNLPTEMKLAVVDCLDALGDVKSLSMIDQNTYRACLPATFKNVRLNSLKALQEFLDNVPRDYCRYIKQLDLCTEAEGEALDIRAQTEVVNAILLACSCLEDLVLRTSGTLHHSVIPCFQYMHSLKSLTINHSGPEDVRPLSERLVVSIAASIPNLQRLSLDRVSRSLIHAPELQGVYPYIPLVTGDNDIPDHPILGSELYLPSLLRIPTLRELYIRDTHLGDPKWITVPVACRLQVLHLGSCYHEREDVNSICTERIMAAVGPSVDEFSLTTSVSDMVFAKPSVTPLQCLRKLHISPFFPVDSIVDTMTNLAGSPIESVSLQCYEDDLVDVCSALEEFLALRVEKGSSFYDKLSRIDVAVTASDDSLPVDLEENVERRKAARRLQELCRDLRLASQFKKAIPAAAASRLARSTGFVPVRWNSASDGRVRAMTL